MEANNKEKINFGIIIFVATTLFNVGVFYGGYTSLGQRVEKIEAIEPAVLKNEINNIKKTLDEIKLDFKELLRNSRNPIR